MNLHIKVKHNGGTKKEREAFAVIKLIFRKPYLMQKRGDNNPLSWI